MYGGIIARHLVFCWLSSCVNLFVIQPPSPCSPSDPDILADIQEWKKDLAQYSSQYVGQTLVYLNGTFEECRFRECNLGNLICDAMVSITQRIVKGPILYRFSHLYF